VRSPTSWFANTTMRGQCGSVAPDLISNRQAALGITSLLSLGPYRRAVKGNRRCSARPRPLLPRSNGVGQVFCAQGERAYDDGSQYERIMRTGPSFGAYAHWQRHCGCRQRRDDAAANWHEARQCHAGTKHEQLSVHWPRKNDCGKSYIARERAAPPVPVTCRWLSCRCGERRCVCGYPVEE
jgi:hypothetical protein